MSFRTRPGLVGCATLRKSRGVAFDEGIKLSHRFRGRATRLVETGSLNPDQFAVLCSIHPPLAPEFVWSFINARPVSFRFELFTSVFSALPPTVGETSVLPGACDEHREIAKYSKHSDR